jgi:transposase
MAKTKNQANSFSVIHPNAAGLDIGASEIYAAVPEGRDEENVRSFPTFTVDLLALADWMQACGVDTVAMESTGVYWIPIYEILEARGIEVYLVNAHHAKNVPGRKTDVLDCQWIQQLHTFGLLRASFRPQEEISVLRSLVRHRENLVRYRSAHIQHMQKALQLMNVQLTQVVSDITGVTGLSIIRAIVAGEHDPLTLARFRHPACAKSSADIAKALDGHYKAEHLFALAQALEAYDFYNQQMLACDREIEAHYDSLPPAPPNPESLPPAPTHRKPRKNQANFDLTTALFQTVGVDLTAIDGIDALTAQTVISEIGLDMNRWPSVKHFTSWLGLAPNPEKSGGKVLRSHTRKTNNRANTALRIAAQSLARSQSALGAFYRRIRARQGAPKAITATAHKLARMIYYMLKHRRPYQDPGATYYEQQYHDRILRNLRRKAAQLGMQLIPRESLNVDQTMVPVPNVS